MSIVDEWMAGERKNRIERIVHNGESNCEFELHCPYCGRENFDDIYLRPGADWVDCDCEKCDRTFLCMAELTYSSKVVTK